jgi:hypothetical protein
VYSGLAGAELALRDLHNATDPLLVSFTIAAIAVGFLPRRVGSGGFRLFARSDEVKRERRLRVFGSARGPRCGKADVCAGRQSIHGPPASVPLRRTLQNSPVPEVFLDAMHKDLLESDVVCHLICCNT